VPKTEAKNDMRIEGLTTPIKFFVDIIKNNYEWYQIKYDEDDRMEDEQFSYRSFSESLI
jgi:hypothetical protein